MTQLGLFNAPTPETIPSPLCKSWALPCLRAGRAVVGPPRVTAGCVTETVTCLTCGCTGERSTRGGCAESQS